MEEQQREPDVDWLQFISTTPDPEHQSGWLGLCSLRGWLTPAVSAIVTATGVVLSGWFFFEPPTRTYLPAEFDLVYQDSDFPGPLGEDWAEQYLQSLAERVGDRHNAP